MSELRLTVEHFGLPARDPAALAQWYERVLCAARVWQSDTTPPAFFVRLPGLMLEIYASDRALADMSDNQLAGWRHLALRVESIETAREELARRGVNFTQAIKPAGGGGRVLFFSDTEGNLLHLIERSQDSPLFK
ncbi:MAG: VOC family protein [Verrucomicrobia bacterium]|nr:VOC family protein [Verrucomicrobiota bacterium]